MTEKSFLWDGTTVGDALLAPYDQNTFNRWLFASLTGDDSTCAFVVPGHLEDLAVVVSLGAINTLLVKPGAAVLNNFIYINDEDYYFTIDPILDSTKSYRYDSIVLQLNPEDTTKKVRLELVLGVESATYPPTAPTLTQTTGGEWQIEIYRILINSTAYVLDQKYVYDQRYFIPTDQHRNDSPQNLLRNSEFMAAPPSAITLGGIIGAGWWGESSGVTSYIKDTKLSTQKRGHSIKVSNCAENEGIFQWFYLRNNSVFSVEGLIEPLNATSDVLVSLIGYDSSYIALEQRDILIPGQATPVTTQVRCTHAFTDPDTVFIKLAIRNGGVAGATFNVGQFIVSEGYFTGGLRPIHETLMFDLPVTSTSWDGDAKSTGTTTIDLLASFGNNIPAYTRSIIATLRCRDSGSAATADVNLRALSYSGNIIHGRCQIGRVTNDKWRTVQCIIPVDDDLKKSGTVGTMRFVLGVTASGAATLEAFVEIVGIIV